MSPRRKKNYTLKNPWRLVGALVVLVLLTGGAYVGYNIFGILTGIYDPAVGPSPAQEAQPDERINVLVLGADRDAAGPKTARSDAIMVVSVDPMQQEVGLLSIPRDTRVEIPGRPSPEKIGHALAHGGADLARRTVEGFLDVRIHNTVVIDFDAFIGIVDALGGVEVDVDRHLQYSDPSQDLYINIEPGAHHMDGQMALEFVRYRSDSDLHRIGRQQQFVKALVHRLLHVRSFFNLPQLKDQVVAHVSTDMESSRMLTLLDMARRIKPDDLHVGTIPGRDAVMQEGGTGVYYWIADEQAAEVKVDTLIRGIDPERNSRWAVRVLNGSGVAGNALAMAEKLERWGYTVVDVGDADHYDYEQTLIVLHEAAGSSSDGGGGDEDGSSMDHAGQLLARDLLYLLEGTPLLRPEPANGADDEAEVIHFTLVVGHDFDARGSTAETAAAAP